MTIYIKNHDFHYELENLCRIFFPNEKISIIKDQMPDAASSFWALAYPAVCRRISRWSKDRTGSLCVRGNAGS